MGKREMERGLMILGIDLRLLRLFVIRKKYGPAFDVHL